MDSFKKMPINWAFKCLKMKPSIVSKRDETKINVCFHKKTVPKNKEVSKIKEIEFTKEQIVNSKKYIKYSIYQI